MKILTFVDLHGSLTALKKLQDLFEKEKPDIIICPGDISIFEQNINYLAGRIAKFNKPTLMLHGNHEDASSMRKVCSKYDNLIFMHGQAKVIDGVLFLGWGGGGFSIKDEMFEKKQKMFEKIMKDYDKVVLLTHAPPYGTKLDKIIDENCGNKSIRNFIKKHKNIVLAICGHLHENSGKEDKIANIRVVNPGPFGKVFTI